MYSLKSQLPIGTDFVSNANLQNPSDTAASGFYISNAYNSFIGNVASGKNIPKRTTT
jgi:hypothetical protein